MILITLYAASAVFGGILIGASVLGVDKAHEAELHADSHTDHGPVPGADSIDHDAAHGDSPHDVSTFAATLLSTRFWTFALASFGVTGGLLHLVGVADFLGFPVAVFLGAGIGIAVATMFRLADKRNVGSLADVKALRGKEAVVLLPITPSKPGKIRVVHDGGDLDLLAYTRDHLTIPVGDRVLVVDMKAGEATVTPLHATHPSSPGPA